MEARTLRCLSSAQVATLSKLLITASQAWTHAWDDVHGDGQVKACETVNEQVFNVWITGADQWQWFALEQIPFCQVWLAAPLDAVHNLGNAMGWLSTHTGREGDSVGYALAERAWQDLLVRLGAALGLLQPQPLRSSSPIPQLEAPFSGAAMAHLVCGEVPVIVAIAGDRVASLAPPDIPAHTSSSPIQTITLALAEQHVRLACSLGPSTIDLGTLTSLTVGDVLLLEHRLDEPLYLSTDDGAPVCRAYLGKRGPLLAIELTSETSLIGH